MSRIASNLGGMIDVMWGKMMLQALPKKVAVPGNTWHILAPVQIASPDCCRLPENLFERLFESFHIVSHCLIPSNPSSFPPFPALRLAPPCLYTRCIDPQFNVPQGDANALRCCLALSQKIRGIMAAFPKDTPVISSHPIVGNMAVACGFKTVINLIFDNYPQQPVSDGRQGARLGLNLWVGTWDARFP